jgi:hypothetical protein
LDSNNRFNEFIHALKFYGDEEMDLSEYWDPKDSNDNDN